MTKPFAEITETSLTTWNAASWQWNELPDFGSFVWTQRGERKIFGVVVASSIASADNSRITMLYQKTEEELLRDQPQLMHFIRSSFTCAVIGFEQNKLLNYQLPPAPAQLHGFVHAADLADIERITSQSDYLQILAKTLPPIAEREEVWIAIASHLTTQNLLSEKLIESFIHNIWNSAHGDYQTIRRFAHRLQKLLNNSAK